MNNDDRPNLLKQLEELAKRVARLEAERGQLARFLSIAEGDLRSLRYHFGDTLTIAEFQALVDAALNTLIRINRGKEKSPCGHDHTHDGESWSCGATHSESYSSGYGHSTGHAVGATDKGDDQE